MRLEVCQCMQEADSILVGFSHANDATATDSNSGATDGLYGAQAVFIAARADDATVKLGRGIQIVVIGGQPRGGEALSLIVRQHSQRAADFEVERGDGSHHFQNSVEVAAVSNFTPRRAHAETAGAFVTGPFCRSTDFLDGH